MFRFFRKHRTVVMVALAACIGGMILFQIGTTSFLLSPHDTIVKVNGQSIAQIQFDRVYNQMIRQRTDATPDQRKQMLSMAFNELIRQEVFAQEAKTYGLEITDQELQFQLAAIPAFQTEGKFDPRKYVQVVGQAFGENPADFEKSH